MTRSSMVVVVSAALALPTIAAAQDPTAVADGARVWAEQCTRCHNARPSTERTDAQWLTIMAHMRARANLTRTQTRLVTTFLKATNFPEVAVAQPAAPERVSESANSEPEASEPDGGGPTAVLLPEEWLSLVLYLRSLTLLER